MPDVVSLERNSKAMLDQLRRGTPDYSVIAWKLKRSLNKLGLSLADIGTDEHELVQLKFLGAEKMAKHLLELLRQTPSRGCSEKYFDIHRSQLSRELEVCDKSLADLGSSEAGLSKLRQRVSRNVRL